MLPNVSIGFENGVIGSTSTGSDGVFALVVSAVAVGTTFELNKPYLINSLVDVADLGIVDSVDNHRLYKALSEFYNEVAGSAPIWVMGMDKATTTSSWYTPDETTGKASLEKLLDSANGDIKAIFPVYDGTTPIVIENGMDADVLITANKAQILAEKYTKEKYAPFITVLEAYAFDGDVIAMEDLTTYDYNRVAILVGDSEKRTGDTTSNGAALGVLAGRLATIQVHENIGRVKNGALSATEIYIVDEAAELADLETIYEKGYISFRTHQGKSGYFFTDDQMATEADDDYKYITRRRVIDKAYRIAYTSLVDELLDDVTVTNEGTIDAIYAKTIEGVLENAIASNMTAFGELSVDSTDKDDLGVTASVDTVSDFRSTSIVNLGLGVKPKGHARYFNVNLGYTVES